MKRIIIAGGSGFLGRALAEHFDVLGYEILILTRRPSVGPCRELPWDGCTLGEWADEFDGATAVINLAGKSVDCRYHARNRKEIMDSRIPSTRVIGQAIQRCKNPPSVWLNASTATIYKHNFGPAWDESGEIGGTPEAKDIFSIDVATAWEREFERANTPKTRKVALRTAMVLGFARNSVFPVLTRLTRLGLGGKMGTGKQFVSFVHQSDFCRAVQWILEHEELNGVINIAAPNPLPNAEMMRIMRQVCGVPIGLPATESMLEIGAFFLRTETELLIKSRRVISKRLPDSGFVFQFPTFREAATNLLKALGNKADRGKEVTTNAH